MLGIAQGDGEISRDAGIVNRAGVGVQARWQIQGDYLQVLVPASGLFDVQQGLPESAVQGPGTAGAEESVDDYIR